MVSLFLGEYTLIKDPIRRAKAVSADAITVSWEEYERLEDECGKMVLGAHHDIPSSFDERSDAQEDRYIELLDPLVLKRFCQRKEIRPEEVTEVFVVGARDFGVLETYGSFPNAVPVRL